MKNKRIIILTTIAISIMLAVILADAKPLTAQDAIWLCRYNVGVKPLKGGRLTACMNYSRRVMKNYDETLKMIQNDKKVEIVK